MKNIVFDVTRLIARHSAPTPTGIDRVDIHYANHFLKSDDYKTAFVYQNKSVFYLLPKAQARLLIDGLYSRWIDGKSSNPLSDIYKKSLGSTIVTKASSASIRFVRHTHANIEKEKSVDCILANYLSGLRGQGVCYYNVSHHGVGNIDAYYMFKLLCDAKIVFYLHDLIPIDFPEYVRPGDDESHRLRVNAMAQCADLVLVNSDYTKQSFLSFCAATNSEAPSIEIAYIGVENSFLKLLNREGVRPTKASIESPYFIMVSTIEPRKNHMLILQLWRQMLTEYGSAPKLVIVGKRGWNIEHVSDFLDRSPSLKQNVIELSGLSDEHMIDLVENSVALLFPSFVEGWGMPVVEAIALKVPVVCSDIQAFRESGQNLAIYLDPLDTASWKQTILKLTNDQAYMRKIKKRLENYRLPDWKDHFELVDRVCAEMFSKRQELIRYAKNSNFTNQSRVESRLKAQSKIIKRKLPEVVIGSESISKFRRKLKKLRKDPDSFFRDSKYRIVRGVGKALEDI